MTGNRSTALTDRYADNTSFTALHRSHGAARDTAFLRGRSGVAILALQGELDLASAPALGEHLLAALPQSARLLILDLSGVTFCDAAGLTMLIGIQRHATGLGLALRLSAPRPQVAKLLRITGLDRGLAVHPDPSSPAPDAGT